MSRANELPNFFLIGAAKSGTTALFDLLAQHPQVFTPLVKEPRFFNNDANYSRGVDWYIKTYFKDAGKFTARGEATPHYLFWGEKVVTRILQTYDPTEIKIVAIFRDPVKRAYSQYWMHVQGGIEHLSFRDALAAEDQRLTEMHQELEPAGLVKYAYYQGGCYATLLQPYLQKFPRQQLHLMLQEDLKTDFLTSMHRLTEFLGIQTDFKFQQVVSNPAYVPRIQNRYFLRLSPIYKKLVFVLPESSRYQLRNWVLKANRRPISNPPIDRDVEHFLRGRYHDEIKQLETILDRDLSLWIQEAA
jgi:hypothetical protein